MTSDEYLSENWFQLKLALDARSLSVLILYTCISGPMHAMPDVMQDLLSLLKLGSLNLLDTELENLES